uniref:EF-hand domain-containing protein n=1 Tax=Globodera pallida TaxID=36090 RepID=A0A183BIL1_GLOPA
MGQRASSLPKDEIAGITQETGFSRNQIICLHERFLQLSEGREFLVHHDLQIMEINPFQNRVIEAFFMERRIGFTLIDTDMDGYLTRNDLEAVLNLVVSDVAEEQRDSPVDRLMAEADADEDGKITFEKLWNKSILSGSCPCGSELRLQQEYA